jgi:hypothetical protein
MYAPPRPLTGNNQWSMKYVYDYTGNLTSNERGRIFAIYNWNKIGVKSFRAVAQTALLRWMIYSF